MGKLNKEMKKIIIDTTKKDLPQFIYEENQNLENGFLMCEVEVAKNEEYKGRVLSISTNGKYIVELLEEIN
jgi:hypothetical protein